MTPANTTEKTADDAAGPVLPPFAYYGGKTRIAPAITTLLAPHTHYVEPFAGSLAVLLAKPPARLETVNDLDGDLMLFWRVLRDRPDELARACALTPHSRVERDLARQRPAELDEVERARRVWVCLSQGRTGTLRNTGWRCDTSDDAHTSMPTRLAGYTRRLEAVAARISRVSLECRPALEVIGAYGGKRRTLLYVDPPYLARTRGGHNYRTELGAEYHHRRLAEALHDCVATVVLSGYPSDLYDHELYPGWYRRELPAATSQGGTWHHRVEVLWSNRPFPAPAAGADTALELFTDTATTGSDTTTATGPTAGSGPARPHSCQECGRALTQEPTGRPRTTCSDACRTARARRRRRARAA